MSEIAHPYYLWGRLPQETLEREYKEFCSGITNLLPFKHRKALIDGEITPLLDAIFIENLKTHYISTVLPRYLSAMGNTEMDKEFGTFYIGVGDNGTITGIPTTCYHFEKIVKQSVSQVVNQLCVNIAGVPHRNLLGSLVKTDVIELDYDEDLIDDDASKMIEDYTRATETAKTIEEKYLETRSKENEIIFSYGVSLYKLCNKDWYRKEVAEWLNTDAYLDHLEDLKRRGYFDEYVDGDHYLRELTKDEKDELLIFYNSTNKINVNDDGGIPLRRARVRDPLCWITLYRDYVIWRLKAERTKRPGIVYPREINSLLCHTLTPLTKRILTKTPHAKYYIIKITIPTATKLKTKEYYNCKPENISVEFKGDDGEWSALVRRNIDPMGPSCVWC